MKSRPQAGAIGHLHCSVSICNSFIFNDFYFYRISLVVSIAVIRVCFPLLKRNLRQRNLFVPAAICLRRYVCVIIHNICLIHIFCHGLVFLSFTAYFFFLIRISHTHTRIRYRHGKHYSSDTTCHQFAYKSLHPHSYTSFTDFSTKWLIF